jgi:hypothetical protein
MAIEDKMEGLELEVFSRLFFFPPFSVELTVEVLMNLEISLFFLLPGKLQSRLQLPHSLFEFPF